MKNLNLRYFRDLALCAVLILTVKTLLAEPAKRYSSFSHTVHRNHETVVYITNTGTKYHKSSCRYLNQSKIKTTLKKAVAAGNVACKVCKPLN